MGIDIGIYFVPFLAHQRHPQSTGHGFDVEVSAGGLFRDFLLMMLWVLLLPASSDTKKQYWAYISLSQNPKLLLVCHWHGRNVDMSA